MPPEPLYPAPDRQQFWLWEGHEVDLTADHLPRLVRAAVLAHQDADPGEERDIAEVLAWTVELHPPWDGHGCPTCATTTPCDDQQRAEGLATEFLLRKSADLVARARATITRIEQKRAQQ